MKKEHAIVILMGILMLGSVLIVPTTVLSPSTITNVNNVVTPESYGTTAATEQLTELKMNVNENPSFETMNAEDWFDTYSGFASGYRHADPAYTSIFYSGAYAGYIAAQCVPGSGESSASLIRYFGSTPYPFLSDSPTLDFYWNTLFNPDISMGSRVYILVQTTNDTGYYHELRYYLSNSIFSISNSTSRTSYMWNFSIGNWNYFSRDIEDDFNANPLIGPADSTRRITYVTWYAVSNSDSTNKIELAIDDVSLSNGTYSSWIPNGDFDSGDGQNWMHYDSTPLYVSQSTDSRDGTYSLNMTSGVNLDSSANAQGAITRSYSYPTGYYIKQPGDLTVEFDWKHNRTLGSIYPYSTFRVTFENETDKYNCHFILGFGGDEIIGFSNDTNNFYFALEGFNIRDTWHHAVIDLYDYLSEFGSLVGTIDEFWFYVYVPNEGSQFSLLVDDFNVITSVTGDPGFEQDWYESSLTVFAGWERYTGSKITNLRTTDAFSGTYACNLTPYTNYDNSAGLIRTISFKVSPNDFLNAWWKLDAMSGVDETYALIKLELDGGLSLNYLLGGGPVFSSINSTSNWFFRVENFNTTGSWTNLHRNITADAEVGLSITGDLIINNVVIRMRSDYDGSGPSLNTLIMDDLIITDGAPPEVGVVEQLPISPMYYDAVDIHVSAIDSRPGIDHVTINYTTNGGITWNSLLTSGTYDTTIPAQVYGTLVEYYVIALDGVGLETVDDNDGVFYSYVVGDDINPSVSIDSPNDMDEVYGDMTIEVIADDIGSDIDYIEFYIGETLLTTDYTAPYSHYVYLEIYDLGMYSVNVTAYDNAGNIASDSINITIVDGIAPDISPLDDVVMNEGVLGEVIDWNPTDTRPASYEVYIDDVLSVSGLWNSSSDHVVVSLDGLAAGIYNYTCVAYDDGGNTDRDTVMVQVIDSVIPEISNPSDVELTEGTTGQSISWTGTDLHPAEYIIYLDGTQIASGIWNSSLEMIIVSLDGLAPGEYNFTCSIADESGNWISDSVIVTVNALTPTTSTSTETTTSSNGGEGNDTQLLLFIGIGIGALLIVAIVCSRMRKK